MQELTRARLQDALRRAELKRLEREAAQPYEPAVNGTVGSPAPDLARAERPRLRPATRPAISPMRPADFDSHPRFIGTEAGIGEELVLRLKGLVHTRTLLERTGAPAEEIERHTAEINKVRLRLAELVRESAEDYGSAA
jgi:hypothetical protein